MTSIADGLKSVQLRIAAACAAANRSVSDVKLVAVSKTHPAAAIREAYALGQRAFGENYVQELVKKAEELADLPDLEWHLIGHLQRNKVKDVSRITHVVETVDSERLALALAERATFEKKIQNVFIQVNVGGEGQKSGCLVSELGTLVATVRAQSSLNLRGLMTVPPEGDAATTRPYFAQLRSLASREGLHELSMGMSGDLEAAIAEGATSIRVGTAIFGHRGRSELRS